MAGKKYSIEFMLGAGLESTFAKSFNQASNSMRDLQTKVNELGKHRAANTSRGVRDDLSKTRQAMVLTQNAATKMSSMIGTAFAAAGGIYLGYKAYAVGKDIIKSYADFEQGMQNVKALSGATNEELAHLTQKAKELNASTKFDGVQVADGMGFLAMAGYKTNGILAAMPGLLAAAAAGKEELGVTADITSNILQGFGIATEETGRVADVLTKAFTSSNVTMGMIGETMKYVAPQSKAAGISLEETAAAAGILGNAGIQASMAGTGLRSIIARMAAPTGKAASLMKELGISAVNSDGSLKSLAEIIESVTKGTAKMGEAERISAVKLLAGQYAASSMLSLMDVGADRLREFTHELENSGGAAQEIAETQMDSFHGSIEYMTSVVNAAKIAIGEKFAPAIRKMANSITTNLPGMIDKFENLWAAMESNPDFQNADWLGKFQIGWDTLISKPFRAWWDASGKDQFSRVATEMGRAFAASIKGVIKEAFTGSGATQALAAGAIAIPGIKIGSSALTTAATIKSLGSTGGTAAKGVSAAAKSVSLLGPALSLLTGPVGWITGGIVALTGGIIAFNKHQEKSRQELINMGDALNNAESKYQAVADKAKYTKALTDEYRELNTQVSTNAGTVEELADAQQRMADITEILQGMFPQTLTNYDLEKGKILEKMDLFDQMTEAERKMEKMRLEATVAEKRADQGKLEKQIGKLEGEAEKAQNLVDKIYEQQTALNEVIPLLGDLETEWRKIMEMDYSEDRNKMLEELTNKANAVGNDVGFRFEFAGQLDGIYQSALDKLADDAQKFTKAMDKLDTKNTELTTAKSSYQELYDAQMKIIELDLGTTLEQAAENYKNMTDTEKARFDAALISIDQINSQMKLLTDEPFTIHVQTVFDTAHQLTGVPQSVRQSYNAPTFKPSTPYGMTEYADGGFASQASIFGEAGLEAAIPIDNRPRSHALLDQVNRLMGHSSGGSVNVTYAPVTKIMGNADNATASQFQQLLADQRMQFESMLEDALRNQRRLSF